jgi:hypothetical protein
MPLRGAARRPPLAEGTLDVVQRCPSERRRSRPQLRGRAGVAVPLYARPVPSVPAAKPRARAIVAVGVASGWLSAAAGRIGCSARSYTATGVENSGRPSDPVGPPTRTPTLAPHISMVRASEEIWCSSRFRRRLNRHAARHRVWQQWPGPATRLRPCGLGRAGTHARLGPSTWPLSWADGTEGTGRAGRDGPATARI